MQSGEAIKLFRAGYQRLPCAQSWAMASPRRSRLRFSDLPDQDDADVAVNQSTDEYDPQDLHDEEVGKEEEEEEEDEALDQLEYQPKEVDSANFLSKMFWWWVRRTRRHAYNARSVAQRVLQL